MAEQEKVNAEEPVYPEPPKDENGNPIAPPKGRRPPMPPHGGRPPEPPRDENGNPIAPPDGAAPPPHHGGRPPRPPKEAAEAGEAKEAADPESVPEE